MSPRTKRAPPVIPPETRPAILRLIREASEPVKAAALIKSAGLAKGITAKALQAFLDEDLGAGAIFNWGSNATPAYWRSDRQTQARERLLSIAAKELVTDKELIGRAAIGPPKLPAGAIKDARAKLASEQRLSLLTSPPGSKTKVVVDTQHPEPYLEAEIARLLQSFGRERPASRIRALISDEPAAEAQVATATVQEVAEKMFDAMNRIAFSPGTTVTFYRLRQQPELAHVTKAVFDEAALLLQRERKALLSLHGHAPALPADEREKLVTDGLGTYYVSIYAR